MPNYIVAWNIRREPLGIEGVKIFERDYRIFNSEDSIKNREEATILYDRLKEKQTTVSISFSKIIESEAFPERLK